MFVPYVCVSVMYIAMDHARHFEQCPAPHSSFPVRNQATDAGELALGQRDRPWPPWVASGETQAEPWTLRFRSDTSWGFGDTAALWLLVHLDFFFLVFPARLMNADVSAARLSANNWVWL